MQTANGAVGTMKWAPRGRRHEGHGAALRGLRPWRTTALDVSNARGVAIEGWPLKVQSVRLLAQSVGRMPMNDKRKTRPPSQPLCPAAPCTTE
jgi:hypothetical protein